MAKHFQESIHKAWHLCPNYNSKQSHSPWTCLRFWESWFEARKGQKKKSKRITLLLYQNTAKKKKKIVQKIIYICHLRMKAFQFFCFQKWFFFNLPGNRHVFSLVILLEDPYKEKHLHHYRYCQKNYLACKAVNAVCLRQQRC